MASNLAMIMHLISGKNREVWWHNGRSSDSGARGRGFDPHSGRRVVSVPEQDTFTSQKVPVILRKRLLHPDMTEKWLTGT